MPEFSIDADRVAFLEAEGWRAYYDHNWPRMLSLMIQINREQFFMPWPAALQAAFCTVQAGRSWTPPKVDAARTQQYLTMFYRRAARYSGLSFEPARAAEQEMAYWVVHRTRRAGGTHEEYVEKLAALHATLFGLTEERARESADLRVQANEIVIEITEQRVTDPDGAWAELTEKLRGCYRSVNRARASQIGADSTA